MQYRITHKTLHFRQPAGTSRGVYHVREVWYVEFSLTMGRWGERGECAPLPDLSCDALPPETYEARLHEMCQLTCQQEGIPYEALCDYPSMQFGIEAAWAKVHRLLPTDMPTVPTNGTYVCPINGLIWMGTYEEMRLRLEEKLHAGFRCIKLKIGAIHLEQEMALLQRIRAEYPHTAVELRVDANGAFRPGEEVHATLAQLAAYDIHSIEQPIHQGQWEEMAELCRTSPLPIALDEELIGINQSERKKALLDTICPQYIVLKPSLHGGLRGCEEWIQLAEERHIGWWVTSALESNVGLADIARWLHAFRPNLSLPQGLGTGLLYQDNTSPETEVRGDSLYLL